MSHLTCSSAGRLARALAVSCFALLFAVVARATIGASLQTQLGNPSSATADPANHAHYLIQRDQYGLDYSDVTRQGNWVSWDLTSGDVGGSGRSAFMQDTTLPAGFYQVLTTDYSGSGYDRGHMCPSADRTVTVADNQQVFFMSNMVPQAPDNNQGIWANFESYCRSVASTGNELLILCGPSGFSGSTIASGVSIPGYTWKIVVVVPLGSGSAVSRITTSTRVIAIKVPNIAGIRSTPWQNFVTSVAQLEADTGFTFFSNLPASTRAALLPVVDGQSASGSPVITGQPGSQTTVVGGSASFSVTATGDAPLSYQWYKDDDQAVPGVTTASLTLSNVQAADGGSYYVVVTNPIGSATSSAAPLVIMGLSPSITTSPSSQIANAGTSVTFAVAATGSPTLTYQWRKDLATIPGATTSTLTLANVQTTNAGSYDVIVTNGSGSAPSASAELTVIDVAPSITTQPISKAATTGSNASFTVLANGTSPLMYTWRKEGTPLTDTGAYSGTGTSTLVINNVSALNAGNYDVIVTNSLGTAPSALVTLTVNPPAPTSAVWNFGTSLAPTADPSGLPGDVTGGTLTQGNNNGTTVLLTTTSASGSYTGASGGMNAGAAARIGALNQAANGSAYFEFTLTPVSGKRLYVSGTSFGMRSTSTGPQACAVYTSMDDFAVPVATATIANDSAWRLLSPTFSPVTGATSAPVTFRIYGYNGAGSPGAGTANWRMDDLKVLVSTIFPPPVAPLVSATTPLTGSMGVPITSAVTVTFNEAVSFTGSWFTIQSALNGPIAATVTGGPTTFTLTPPSFFAYNDTVTVTVHGAQVVDQATGSIPGSGDTVVSFTTESYVPPTPPSVTSHPTSQSVNVGDTASFTVTASGTAPLKYQWRKGGLAIAGNTSASAATLTLTGVTLGDAGNYDCLVSNAAGSDVSHIATLSVSVVAPSITTQPVAQMAAEGGTATFTVVAGGTAPFTYQWRKNGNPIANGPGISGAGTASLTLSDLTYLDSGSYDVVVTNSAGFATSHAVALAVTSDAPAVVYWNFATADPTSGVPAGVTGGTVSQGNNNGTTALLTTTSASGSYAGASGGNNAGAAARIGALNQGTNGSAYFEFTFTPPPGRQFVASAINFGSRSTGTGPQAYAIFSSVDNFAAPIASGALLNDSVWRLITPAFKGVVGAAGMSVKFRIFGYNGTGSPGTGTANWRIDDVKLSAGLLAVAVPPSITTQPAAQTVTVGDTVTFTVAATGTAPLAYQWRKEGSPIVGNTSAVTATLTLSNVTTVDAASYDCIVSNVAGSVPSDAAVLVVNKATVPVTLGTLSYTYDGQPHGTTATTSPSGLNVVITYDGAAALPVNAGLYAVVASVVDANYAGTTNGTLVISKAPATVTLTNLAQVYSGASRIASATTLPSGLAVTFTYDGSATPPTNAGSYAVVGTIYDNNYAGSASGTLLVAKAAAVVTLGSLNATYTGSPLPVTATTTPVGLSVVFTYDGGTTAPTNAGVYAVTGTIDSMNYSGSATGTLVIGKATAAISLANLYQTYDGTPKTVTATTSPEGLNVTFTYNGNPAAPVYPGTYAVVATVDAPNYRGSATGNLVIGVTAFARHGLSLSGGIDGSLQIASPENVSINSSGWISGDLLVPGTPGVSVNSRATYAGTVDGPGGSSPSNYAVALNGSATVRHVVRRIDAPAMPTVAAPAAPTGTRNVALGAGQGAGDFATLRDLTLNSKAGQVAVPPGTYGNFTANAGTGFTLGIVGATEPAAYNFQSLTLNGRAVVEIVGPVVVTLATGTSISGDVGNAEHPEWLTLNAASGGVAVNSGATVNGAIIAPTAGIEIGGTVKGATISDSLTLNSHGLLETP